MGYSNKRIGAATVAVNDDTKALRVDAMPATSVLAGPTKVTVDNTANGKTLATLLGAALNADLKVLTLIPASVGIYWAAGNASAASAWMPAGGVEITTAKTAADAFKFYAAANIEMVVVQEG